jgi:hypothetical protein
MNRLMATSQAYQMSSDAGPADVAANQRIDPNDTYLWHFRLQRLEAEPIWDSIHAAAGRLDLKVGGPSFVPGKSDGKRRRQELPNSDVPRPAEAMRRGTYIVRGFSTSRDVTPDFLQTFDVDDGRAPCPMRTQTVTAPQALFLMNSPEVEDMSAAFADRVRTESAGDLGKAVELAYRLTLARPPTRSEADRAFAYLQNDAGRLKQLAWLLFNLDEFIYVR